MADYQLPSFQQFQGMSADPRTEALAEIPNAIQGSLGLADVLQQKQLARKQQIMALQQQVQQHIAEVKAAKLAVPITPQTPASTQVPATLGGLASPQTSPTGEMTATPTPELPAQLEAQRPGLFEQAAIQAQPKEAIKDIFAEMRAQQKSSAKPEAWKTVGITNTPDGKKHAVQSNVGGEFRTVDVPAGTELTVEQFPKARMAQTVGYLNKDLVDSLSLTKAPDAIKRVNNTLAGIIRFKPLEEFARDKGLNPQELTEIARNVDAIVSATGRPTVSITKELLPRTAKGKYSSIEQWLTSKPSPQDYKEFLDRYQDLRGRETPKLEQYVKNYQAQVASSKGEFLRQYAPSMYEKTLKAYGIKPSDIKKQQDSGVPSQMFAPSLFGGGTDEEKFNEYTSQGLSESEAYDRIAQEFAGGQ